MAKRQTETVLADDHMERGPQLVESRGPSAEQVLDRLAQVLDPANQAQAQKKAFQPNNQSPPKISSLNPQGDKDYPRPACKFRYLFVPYKAEYSDFTYEEMELVNLLEHGTYQVTRNDGSTIELDVRVTENKMTGKPEDLYLSHPFAFNGENRHTMPPFRAMLREIAEQTDKDTSSILTMQQRTLKVRKGELPISVGM